MSGWRWAELTPEQREAYSKFKACGVGPRRKGTDALAAGHDYGLPDDSYFKNNVKLKQSRSKWRKSART